jgi:hypothetical protein
MSVLAAPILSRLWFRPGTLQPMQMMSAPVWRQLFFPIVVPHLRINYLDLRAHGFPADAQEPETAFPDLGGFLKQPCPGFGLGRLLHWAEARIQLDELLNGWDTPEGLLEFIEAH